MGDRSNLLLERALNAEDKVEALEERIKDLESRVRGALNADPTTASRALSWIGRAEGAENLLVELMRYIDQRSVDRGQFPNGWVGRCEALLRSVAILRRDQAQMAERPEEADYWTTYVDSKGRKGIVKDDSGWMHRP